MFCAEKSRLTLQFHITGRCNLRCKHCYRTQGDTEQLSLADIVGVIDQFLILRKKYNSQHNIKKRGHINLTGGEPFCRSDIKDIIKYIHKHHNQLTYGILSNGSFIDDNIISLLKETNVSFVQLSIDGNKSTHDSLRASGDYTRVFAVARQLEQSGIRTFISFTANKENYRYLPLVARQCRKNHISKLWTDRIVPIGNGKELEALSINSDDLHLYLKSIKKARGGFIKNKLHPHTQVSMERALQFIGYHNRVYSCNAGAGLITVDEFGQIMPCRRMPIICGDVFSDTLENVYYNNPTFLDFRQPYIPKECAECPYKISCNGGARCQSYATYGTYKKADPACPLKNSAILNQHT